MFWWLTRNIWNNNPDYARPCVKLSYRVSVLKMDSVWQALLNVLRIFTLLFLLMNANVNEDMLGQMQVDYFTVFLFYFQLKLCFKMLNYNFLLSQLQITVILLLPLPLNPENPSLFFLIAWNSIYLRSTHSPM